jgi:hypothetical protein
VKAFLFGGLLFDVSATLSYTTQVARTPVQNLHVHMQQIRAALVSSQGSCVNSCDWICLLLRNWPGQCMHQEQWLAKLLLQSHLVVGSDDGKAELVG